MKPKSASRVAFEDIRKERRQRKAKATVKKDTWIATEKYVRTKYTTKLNRDLGIHTVNMDASNMSRKV